MPTDVVVYVLTALAGVVVVLTRLRVRADGGAGQHRVSSPVLAVHTVAGGLAVVVWVVFLAFPEDSAPGHPVVGIVALALWWVVALDGLLVLLRWLPTRGRHAVEASAATWSNGPGLSVLAHLGMVVAVLVFTWVYLTSAV